MERRPYSNILLNISVSSLAYSLGFPDVADNGHFALGGEARSGTVGLFI
jgi:hypothetical protein